METEATQMALQAAEDLLTSFQLQSERPETFRLDFLVPAASLLDVVKKIVENRWGYLSTITGLDHPGQDIPEPRDRQWRQQEQEKQPDRERVGSIEILYHFCSGAAVLTLRTWVSYSNASVASVSTLIPSAILYESELSEMFGVRIRNNPFAKEHFLLPEDWPRNVFPLRKSFSGLKDSANN